jgi:hypothetical protein
MKAKLPQSHLVLLSFAILEFYFASFSLRFALLLLCFALVSILSWRTLYRSFIFSRSYRTASKKVVLYAIVVKKVIDFLMYLLTIQLL